MAQIKMVMPLSGTVCAAVAEPWEMKDPDTERINRGITRRLFVVQDFGLDPVEVKLRPEQETLFEQVVKAGPFSLIDCTVRVQQFQGRDATLGLVELVGVKPGAVKAS